MASTKIDRSVDSPRFSSPVKIRSVKDTRVVKDSSSASNSLPPEQARKALAKVIETWNMAKRNYFVSLTVNGKEIILVKDPSGIAPGRIVSEAVAYYARMAVDLAKLDPDPNRKKVYQADFNKLVAGYLEMINLANNGENGGGAAWALRVKDGKPILAPEVGTSAVHSASDADIDFLRALIQAKNLVSEGIWQDNSEYSALINRLEPFAKKLFHEENGRHLLKPSEDWEKKDGKNIYFTDYNDPETGQLIAKYFQQTGNSANKNFWEKVASDTYLTLLETIKQVGYIPAHSDISVDTSGNITVSAKEEAGGPSLQTWDGVRGPWRLSGGLKDYLAKNPQYKDQLKRYLDNYENMLNDGMPLAMVAALYLPLALALGEKKLASEMWQRVVEGFGRKSVYAELDKYYQTTSIANGLIAALKVSPPVSLSSLESEIDKSGSNPHFKNIKKDPQSEKFLQDNFSDLYQGQLVKDYNYIHKVFFSSLAKMSLKESLAVIDTLLFNIQENDSYLDPDKPKESLEAHSINNLDRMSLWLKKLELLSLDYPPDTKKIGEILATLSENDPEKKVFLGLEFNDFRDKLLSGDNFNSLVQSLLRLDKADLAKLKPQIKALADFTDIDGTRLFKKTDPRYLVLAHLMGNPIDLKNLPQGDPYKIYETTYNHEGKNVKLELRPTVPLLVVLVDKDEIINAFSSRDSFLGDLFEKSSDDRSKFVFRADFEKSLDSLEKRGGIKPELATKLRAIWLSKIGSKAIASYDVYIDGKYYGTEKYNTADYTASHKKAFDRLIAEKSLSFFNQKMLMQIAEQEALELARAGKKESVNQVLAKYSSLLSDPYRQDLKDKIALIQYNFFADSASLSFLATRAKAIRAELRSYSDDQSMRIEGELKVTNTDYSVYRYLTNMEILKVTQDWESAREYLEILKGVDYQSITHEQTVNIAQLNLLIEQYYSSSDIVEKNKLLTEIAERYQEADFQGYKLTTQLEFTRLAVNQLIANLGDMNALKQYQAKLNKLPSPSKIQFPQERSLLQGVEVSGSELLSRLAQTDQFQAKREEALKQAKKLIATFKNYSNPSLQDKRLAIATYQTLASLESKENPREAKKYYTESLLLLKTLTNPNKQDRKSFISAHLGLANLALQDEDYGSAEANFKSIINNQDFMAILDQLDQFYLLTGLANSLASQVIDGNKNKLAELKDLLLSIEDLNNKLQSVLEEQPSLQEYNKQDFSDSSGRLLFVVKNSNQATYTMNNDQRVLGIRAGGESLIYNFDLQRITHWNSQEISKSSQLDLRNFIKGGSKLIIENHLEGEINDNYTYQRVETVELRSGPRSNQKVKMKISDNKGQELISIDLSYLRQLALEGNSLGASPFEFKETYDFNGNELIIKLETTSDNGPYTSSYTYDLTTKQLIKVNHYNLDSDLTRAELLTQANYYRSLADKTSSNGSIETKDLLKIFDNDYQLVFEKTSSIFPNLEEAIAVKESDLVAIFGANNKATWEQYFIKPVNSKFLKPGYLLFKLEAERFIRVKPSRTDEEKKQKAQLLALWARTRYLSIDLGMAKLESLKIDETNSRTSWQFAYDALTWSATGPYNNLFTMAKTAQANKDQDSQEFAKLAKKYDSLADSQEKETLDGKPIIPTISTSNIDDTTLNLPDDRRWLTTLELKVNMLRLKALGAEANDKLEDTEKFYNEALVLLENAKRTHGDFWFIEEAKQDISEALEGGSFYRLLDIVVDQDSLNQAIKHFEAYQANTPARLLKKRIMQIHLQQKAIEFDPSLLLYRLAHRARQNLQLVLAEILD